MSGLEKKHSVLVIQPTGSISQLLAILSQDRSVKYGTSPINLLNPPTMLPPSSSTEITTNDQGEIVMTPRKNLATGEIVVEETNPGSVAIIGTREPDEAQIEAARHLAFILSSIKRMKICTGGAYGIDNVAMVSTSANLLEVYLPWDSYNREIIPPHARRIVYNPTTHSDWAASVAKYHPANHFLSRGAIALHARNFGIVAGRDLVIAFPNANGGGGTGQGIRIAQGLGIPVLIGCKTKTKPVEYIAKAMKMLGLIDPNLKPTLSGR